MADAVVYVDERVRDLAKQVAHGKNETLANYVDRVILSGIEKDAIESFGLDVTKFMEEDGSLTTRSVQEIIYQLKLALLNREHDALVGNGTPPTKSVPPRGPQGRLRRIRRLKA